MIDTEKKHYKIWIEVELIDEEEGVYDNIGMPISVAITETFEEAEEIQQQISDMCLDILPDDVNWYLKR